MLKYNLGCGRTRLEGFVNVDINEGTNVDLVMDIAQHLCNLDANSASEIVSFHLVEHLDRAQLPTFFHNCNRLLTSGGKLTVSFPDFSITSKYFLENKRGNREFWEATIFGRRGFPHDEHRCALTTSDITSLMKEFGFVIWLVTHEPEPNECNAVIVAFKIRKPVSYEDALKEI